MKVYSPNKEYTGVSTSVPFCNGVGETDNPHLLEWFRMHGYEVEQPLKAKEEAAENSEETTENEKEKKDAAKKQPSKKAGA